MSRTILVVFLAIAVFAALALTSCSEPEPGEVGGAVSRNGQPFGAAINILGPNGDIIATDQSIDGVYYVRNVPPGTYTIQCVTRDGEVLATDEVTIEPGGSTNHNFDL